MKKIIFKFIMIVLLVITLISSNIIYMGYNIAIALANELEMQSDDTNIANVKFDAYFKTDNRTEHYKQANINNKDICLYLSVNVIDKGSLDNAKIKITDSNFKIKTDDISNKYVKKINKEAGEIELNSVIYNNKIEIEIPIEFNQPENVNEDYFTRESNISLEGIYTQEESQENLTGNIVTRIDWTDDSDINLTEEIEKCIDLGENGILVQQKIVSTIENGILPRESEILNVKVPQIGEYTPNSVNVILNGSKIEDNVNYNKETGILEIQNQGIKNENGELDWNNGQNEYKVIYKYDYQAKESLDTITLSTEVNSKLFTKENIQRVDEKEEQIEFKGNVASVSKKATENLYKGYLYANSQYETEYRENNVIEISDAGVMDNININTTNSYFIGNRDSKYNANDIIVYKGITINKDKFIEIFGEEGYIDIEDSEGNVVETINSQSTTNDNGNINITYEQELENINIKTSKPIKEGEFTIHNIKAIKGETEYTKNQLKSFSSLITNEKVETNLGTDETETSINLLDTKTEAKLELSNTNLSTLQKNENVQFLVTLKSDSAQYDLFKNPQIDIIIPKEINIDVKTITQLNGQDELQIDKMGIRELDSGEKLIRITLTGEQTTFQNSVNEGIQIAFMADLEIPNTTPSQDSKITMNYTNENREEETLTYEQNIKLNSKYGVLLTNELSGFNDNNDVINGIDNNTINGVLSKNTTEKNASETINVINNYQEEISNVSIIGKIPVVEEESINNETFKSTFEMNLINSLNLNGKEAKVYYSDDSNATQTSDTWKESYEEVNNPKVFKIDLGTIAPGERVEINYQVNIPGDLKAEQETYLKNTLDYTYLGNDTEIVSATKLATQMIENNEYSAISENMQNVIKAENDEDISLEIVARSGDKYLAEGDSVKEGQGVVYELKITNNTDQTLENIQIEAINTNAIYYDTIIYEEDVYGDMMEKIKIDENPDLTSKVLEIASLEAGESETVKYQIAVKEVEDGNQTLTGEIKIKADNLEEKSFSNIENKIEEGKLKLKLKNTYSENELIGAKENIGIEGDIINISSEKLENIEVYVQIPEEVTFNLEELGLWDDRCQFVEYKDNVVKLNISELEVGETIDFTALLNVNEFDLDLDNIIVSQFFKAILDGEEYISNETNRVITQNMTTMTITQTSDNTTGILKDGDNLTFRFEIFNKGSVSKSIDFLDMLPDGLEINKATKIADGNEEEIYTGESTVAGTFTVEGGQTIYVEIEATVNFELATQGTISNVATINGAYVDVTSNTLEFILEGFEEEPNEGDEPNNPSTSGYSISGQAWIDSNQDGQKGSDEEKLSNVIVMLIDESTGEIVKNDLGGDLTTQTDSNGQYSFGNLSTGRYMVLFKYDTTKYMITEYKKGGISEDSNSDIVSKRVNINNEEITVGATETLEISSNNIENIDAGFIEGKTFDLRLDKYIKTVIVQDSSGTTTRQYDKQSLAKIELNAKKLANSTVIVEYEINVTNEGEVAGYANEIIDYIPSDLTFSSEINKDWYQTTDGNIATKILENDIINPGETKTLTLALTKKMTQDNTGRIINTAEIGTADNEYALQDIDSTPGNKKDGEDDISTAELIISIGTGSTVLYISLIFAVIVIIGIGVYFINKKILKEDDDEF